MMVVPAGTRWPRMWVSTVVSRMIRGTVLARRFVSSITASRYGISDVRISVAEGRECGESVVIWNASSKVVRRADCASGLAAINFTNQERVFAVVSWP